MTQDQNAAAPTDALLARYHAAQAALDTPEDSGPSAQTRAHILDYAAQIATTSGAARAIKEGASGQFDTEKTAANDGQWKVRALATVAIFGLTSLLLLQWDRGTPEEKDLAFSTARPPEAPRSATAAAPAAAPSPAPSDASLSAPLSAPAITPPAAATPSNAAKAVAPARARDKIESEGGQASASGTLSKAAPTLSAKDEAAVAQAIAPPVALPPQIAAPASETATPIAAGPTAAAPAAGRAPAMRAAPAAKAAEYGAVQSQRGDDTPNAAFFAAIGSGDAAAVQQALANGADKNAKSNGTPAITLCVQANRLAMVRLLAAAGADLNALDAQGLSPLAHAQTKGMDGMATLLRELGAK